MKRWTLAATLTLFLCACRTPPPPPPTPPPDPSGAVERMGLRASLPGMTWFSGPTDTLEVTYSLEWTKGSGKKLVLNSDGSIGGSIEVWLLNPSEPVDLTFLDANQAVAGETSARIHLSDPFIEEEVLRTELLIAPVSVAANAVSLRIALGRSGLETTAVKLPPRIR